MKKFFLIILGAALLLAACAEQQDNSDRPLAGEIVLTARTEQPDSKSVVTDETKVFWEPGDEIVVFAGEKSGKFANELTEPAATAKFKGSIGEETGTEEFWALYPYSEDATFDGEAITTVLPSVQEARAGSFAKDMNLAVAHSDNNPLQFFNVGGGVRFSVTEEGIEKVIFEGLDGEVLAGKVKIGFENGIPKVQEVTSGSIFLTLLPPDGGTFQKDKWYFIVALPGALEKGYKMRFYKGDDYARRISESPVTIKRSIYGTVTDADAGMNYEPTTVSFPETEDEWEDSIAMTELITENVNNIFNLGDEPVNSATDELITELEKVEGVVAVRANSSGTSIAVQQNDGMVINYMLDIDKTVAPKSNNDYSQSMEAVKTKSPASIVSSSHVPDETYFLNAKKKAIILSPYSHYFNNTPSADNISKSLSMSGYQSDNIEIYYDRNASLSFFRGEKLSEYDFICIITHGGTMYHSVNKKGKLIDKTDETSLLCTYVPYNKERALSLFKYYSPDELGVVWLDENRDDIQTEDERFFAVTPEILHDASFNNACVVLFACSSTYFSNRNDTRSLVWRFLDQGARIVMGSNRTIGGSTIPECFLKLLRLCSYGFSLQDAVNHYKSSNSVRYFCDVKYAMLQSFYPKQYLDKDKPNSEFYNLWECYENPSFSGIPYYLVDPFPKLKQPDITESLITFKWDSPLLNFTIPWYLINASFDDNYIIKYDLYIDGKTIEERSNLQFKEGYWANPTLGPHNWFIISKITLNDNVIASYKSDTGYFTVKEDSYETPSLVDLGLPSKVKWATFNLGATKPEESGKFFAWGETEPKSDNTWSTYKWCKGTNTTITKYCWDSSYGYNGFTDNKKELDQEDDAAYAKLKGQFRTPTVDDWREMLENTTHTWTNNYNGTGVAGLVCKSTVSGYTSKSIFLPTAKYGSCGDYMTASAVNTSPDGFDAVYFTENELYGANYDHKCSAGARCEGSTIRPVSGQVTKTAIISLEADRYDFGTLALKSQKRVSLNITNTGNKDLEITSIKMVSGKKGFQLANTVTPPVTISPNYSITINFRFYPTSKGYVTDKIQIESNAANMSTAYITLTGTGE